MKGCARSCLLLLLGWSAAAYAFYRYFVSLRDFGAPMYWGSAFAGLFVVASIGYAAGIGTAYRERKMLLEAIAGTPPADGQWAGISGTIHSTTPLTAPISGERVVAYEYRIQRDEKFGKNRTQVVYYDGRALAPSTVATRQGSVRLLSVPAFTDIEAESIVQSTAVQRAKTFVSSTPFRIFDTATKRRTRIEEEWTDDDGQFRLDRQHFTRDVELSGDFHFEEKHIKQGEQVCVFGLYSRDRGGLIPHPNWAKQTRLMRGDASKVAAQLRRRMINYLIGAIVCGGLVYAIVRLYHYKVATLPL
ncbi:MAG TPA: hypothetical protein VE974_23745 [Thermoanaerobaculia bacterium]|nr:hypothetical protein [Thermoanaerobaculia bacterium]